MKRVKQASRTAAARKINLGRSADVHVGQGEYLPTWASALQNTENVSLGLAITKSIVEMHGGTIGAESAQGRTRFTITLPLRQTA